MTRDLNFSGKSSLLPFSRSLHISDQGVVLGAETILIRTAGLCGTSASETDLQRLFSLLAVAFGRPFGSDILAPLQAAARHWESGDRALANLRLIFAGLPRLDDPIDAMRLCLAEHLLDSGMSPPTLLKELGLASDIAKFDPDQPRYPAGSGEDGGRWRKVTGTFEIETDSAASNMAVAVPATIGLAAASGASGSLSQALFATGAAAAGEFLAGLATLAGSIGTGIVAGAIFVPSPNTVTSEGSLPGEPDTKYSLDKPTGVLRLTRDGADGPELVALAHRNKDGIFFEAETGTPIARTVGDSIVFDAASLADIAPEVQPQARTIVKSQSRVEADTARQLCPDPGPDWPHGASDRAIAYQFQISALNNPERPLRPGLAISLPNPETGRRVVFDDCRESDGTMIEAKGPGYEKLMRSSYLENVISARWVRQASRQTAASRDRELEWYFAEARSANFARSLFQKKEGLQKIQVLNVPAIVR